MFLKRDFICGLAYKQLMKQGKDAYSYTDGYRISNTVRSIHANGFLPSEYINTSLGHIPPAW